MRADDSTYGLRKVGIEAKVSFLSDPRAYPEHPGQLICRETHMSWVFIGATFVYKLKKPVRFSYLDFSTLRRREIACRAELKLNRRLAPTVYVDVVPLTLGAAGLAIGGDGPVVEWLVAMRRLDESLMLESALLDGSLKRTQLDRLATILAAFYAHARPRPISTATYLAEWRRRITENRHILSKSNFSLDFAILARIDRAQRRFVTEHPHLLTARMKKRRIVDGHGDLRPEHIWLGEPISVIDRLEFSAGFRAIDPFDELAFLSVECDRLGSNWPGPYLANRVARLLHDDIPRPLRAFYRCYRATMRARLALSHLLEASPRNPENWFRQGRSYITLALQDALVIERYLAKPGAQRKSGEINHRKFFFGKLIRHQGK